MPATETLSPLATEFPAQPWWRFGIVWFTFGLPATVVVASLFTAGIAWRHIDPVVVDGPVATSAPGRASTITPTITPTEVDARANALEPAQRARNHAATPRP